ncbi:hypothetical protein IAD21_03438 [Abditibacteriota bacterium]|nr:hypothetical protein IAD21_03438 [Abditibacteriota bacterium]
MPFFTMKELVSILFGLLVAAPALAVQTTPTEGLSTQKNMAIDRHALVTRHNVVLTKFNGERPLQVGNGEFAFGMDSTGLQSFVPFNTMSHWGWHSAPLPNGKRVEDYHKQPVVTHGRPILYPLPDPQQPELSNWMTGNPHRINLGRIGLVLTKSDGTPAAQSDIQNPRQELDLWSGLVTSRFTLEGQPVVVTTACHPTQDAIAAHIQSPLINAGRLAVFLDFPSDDTNQFNNFVGNWEPTSDEETKMVLRGQRADFARRYSGDTTDAYQVALSWQGKATLHEPNGGPVALPLVIEKAEYGAADKWLDVTAELSKAVRGNRLAIRASNDIAGDPILQSPKRLKITYTLGGHRHTDEAGEGETIKIQSLPFRERFTLQPTQGKASTEGAFSFVCNFAPKTLPQKQLNAAAIFAASREHWPAFWRSGGAIDLSRSKDPRWKELERRIVLSQYLMATNEAGSLPPQESGLVNNGWFGRFHFEMIWWHAAHWALWNRWPQLQGNISVYQKFLAQAQQLAKEQGYRGARWPKCTGPDGREWPFYIHSFLIWQQPHPIFFAELDYRAHPTRATLEKWRPIVENTADFMASYAFFDEQKGHYVLGPPLTVVSENTDWQTTQNPTFELSYWRTGLRMAQEWRTRLREPRRADWDKVLEGLSPLPQENGLYVLHDGVQDMWTKWNFEHPALTGIYGMLPGDGVDRETMRRTFDKVCATWDFNHTWGWDFPMLAMCAARLGEPNRAIDMLMHPSGGFQFDERGLATGGPFPYFPSNGALLYAVALMAAGWDGAPKKHAPGFPNNGQWTVRFENLTPSP